jgi:hypothetical protein
LGDYWCSRNWVYNRVGRSWGRHWGGWSWGDSLRNRSSNRVHW